MTLTPLTTILFFIATEVLLTLFVILTLYNLLSRSVDLGVRTGSPTMHTHCGSVAGDLIVGSSQILLENTRP